MKIFIGPREISGYGRNLKNGFKEIGIDADFVNLSYHPFNYGGNDNNFITRKINKCNKLRLELDDNKKIDRKIILIKLSLYRIIYFFIALLKYDIFIFLYGHSLFPGNLDLIILKFFKKKIITNISMGSDARPPYLDGSYQKQGLAESVSALEIVKLSEKVKRKISRIEKYSDIIIGAPYSTSQFTVKKFINTFSIGFPQLRSENVIKKSKSDTFIILHSPSHPIAKGTPIIVKAVNNLIEKGYSINLILLQNRTNKEVLEEISRCDFVVDQIYSDTPLAGFACEAASRAKPVIVGGYALKELTKLIPEEMVPPSIMCTPDDIEEEIETLILNKNKNEYIGNSLRLFVENQWSAAKVAERYANIINEKIPKEWYFDPLSIHYLYGAGQNETRTKELITEIVKRYGVSSLQLDHNISLKQAILKFINIEK